MQLVYDRRASGSPPRLDTRQLARLYHHEPPQTPDGWCLRTNFVATLDGSVQGPDGRSGSINTPSDHQVFALHRALADVVLVGASTARLERYRAVDLQAWQRELRSEIGLEPYPTLAIISRSARLDPSVAHAARGDSGPVVVITTSTHPAATLDPLRSAGVEVLELGPSIELASLREILTGRRLRRVLCEGGPRLHRDLLAADLVDELSLTHVPVTVGGAGLRSTAGAALPEVRQFELAFALHADDGALFTHYRRRGV